MDRSEDRDSGDFEGAWPTVIHPHGRAGNRTRNEKVRFLAEIRHTVIALQSEPVP